MILEFFAVFGISCLAFILMDISMFCIRDFYDKKIEKRKKNND